MVTVSSSELSAFEHRKLWCLQTLCWLHGERSLPIELLVSLFFCIILMHSDPPEVIKRAIGACGVNIGKTLTSS